MKTISTEQLSAVVEVDQLGLCELNPSILEKDLLITDVLGLLAAFEWGEVQPVFCGGTSLSKGYGLIQRMSEDIDFKLVLPEAGINALNENRFACFALGYESQFPLATGEVPLCRLRPVATARASGQCRGWQAAECPWCGARP